MLSAVTGLVVLVVLVAGVAVATYAAHVLVRPEGAHDVRTGDALRQFEPRGGRQRFHVRLFESAMLISLWVAGSGVLLLWMSASRLSPLGVLSAAVFAGALVVGTWWAWRRGVLRPIARAAAPNLLVPPRRRRHHG